jgi:hypothetical protein
MPTPAPPNPLANAMAEFLATQTATSFPTADALSPRPPAKAPLDLASAYDKVLEHEALKALPVAERVTLWQRFGRPMVAVVVFMVAAWLWLFPPAWLTPQPDRPVIWPEGPAGTQLLLVNAADAIELFRQNAGRLPLGPEVDSVVPSLLLRPGTGGGFELQAPDGTTLSAPPPAARSVLGYEIASPPGERQP